MKYQDSMFVDMIVDLENNILNNKQIAEKYGEQQAFNIAVKLREEKIKETKI